MKKILTALTAASLILPLFMGCSNDSDSDDSNLYAIVAANNAAATSPIIYENNLYQSLITPNDIKIAERTFACTSFVQVIEPGTTALIPNGNCTAIDDVFLSTRAITLNSYSICKYEVTQELYEFVMEKNPLSDAENKYGSEIQRLRPVAGVNWFEAVTFCNKLSALCGYEQVYTITNVSYANKKKANEYISSATVTWDFSKNGFRLPTEAEWEYASRGAGKTAEDWKYKYSGSDNSKKVAWTIMTSSGNSDDDDKLRTHQVGLKAANALGIHDMSGNVAEWCHDWYRSVTEDNDFSHGNAVKDSGPTTDPCLLKGKYDNHVLRGGAYNQNTGNSLNSQRLSASAKAGYHFSNTETYEGIRLVRRP